MKTESVRKVILIGSVLLIGIAICVSVWFFLWERKTREFQGQNRDGIAADSQHSSQPSQNPDGAPLAKEERLAQAARNMFISRFSEEQLALPHFQKILEAMDSPEYVELLKSSDFSTTRRENSWKSKGVAATQGNAGLFTERPPFMSLADYEPVVRRKLAELFIAAEPVDLTDPVAAGIQRGKVLIELDETDENGLAWFMERFGSDWGEIVRGAQDGMENNPAVIWMNDIQRNAASIVKAAEQARSAALKASAPSWDMSSVMESPSVSSDATMEENPSVSPPAIDALEPPAISKPETDASITPAPELTDMPKTPTNLPTVEGLETSLKEQFSPERFERAMSTLERYGPEEGLRRLRENDPEVARQIERSRQRDEEEVSNESVYDNVGVTLFFSNCGIVHRVCDRPTSRWSHSPIPFRGLR